MASRGAFRGVVGMETAGVPRRNYSIPPTVRSRVSVSRIVRSLFALALYERALVLARTELGPEHPQVRALEAWRNELTG